MFLCAVYEEKVKFETFSFGTIWLIYGIIVVNNKKYIFCNPPIPTKNKVVIAFFCFDLTLFISLCPLNGAIQISEFLRWVFSEQWQVKYNIMLMPVISPGWERYRRLQDSGTRRQSGGRSSTVPRGKLHTIVVVSGSFITFIQAIKLPQARDTKKT